MLPEQRCKYLLLLEGVINEDWGHQERFNWKREYLSWASFHQEGSEKRHFPMREQNGQSHESARHTLENGRSLIGQGE